MSALRATPSRKSATRIIRLFHVLLRLVVDRPYRNMMWLYWRRPSGTFQPFNNTFADRHTRILRFVQAVLGRESSIKILSFGCSTGEEVFSLRRYFPRAIIKGVDINSGNISECRKRLARAEDTMISFDVANSTAGEATDFYDAIFCMAVLRHGDLGKQGITSCDHLLPFADFAAAVADFARCLKPGGLLVLRYSNFRLCDAPTGALFDVILRLDLPKRENRIPIFGPDNRLMPGVDDLDVVFRKRL